MEDTFHLGVKALIRNEDGKILVLKVNPAKLRGGAKAYWDIPGGRVQRGESVEQTLAREVAEEIGVPEIHDVQPLTMVLSNIRIPLRPQDVGLILAIYTCRLGQHDQIVISDEHTDFGWFAPSKAAELLQVKYPETFTRQIASL